MRIFPNAKVVLTVRDAEKWYDSVRGTIYNMVAMNQGTVGLFLKIVGMFRTTSLVVKTSNQGPPVTKQGKVGIYIVNSKEAYTLKLYLLYVYSIISNSKCIYLYYL